MQHSLRPKTLLDGRLATSAPVILPDFGVLVTEVSRPDSYVFFS